MPGKVNPVICEAVMQAAMRVFANDSIVANAAAQGTLEINEFMPVIADSFLETVRLLANASAMLSAHIDGIVADEEVCRLYVDRAPSIMTVLVPTLGYEKVQALSAEFTASGRSDVRAFLIERCGKECIEEALSPGRLLKTGY
jgi:aspartate ammonia-lyase